MMLPEIAISLEAGADELEWTVLGAEIDEGISQLYRAVLQVVTPEMELDLSGLVGARARLRIARADDERNVVGIVWSVTENGRTLDGRMGMTLVIVPTLQRLSRRWDCRIFSQMSLPQIVEAVLETAGVYRGEDQLRLHLDEGGPRAPAIREYCVQYDETDLAFIERLCEEEGVSYYFRHDRPEHETLVLVDATGARAGAVWAPVVTSRDDGNTVDLVPPEVAPTRDRESITNLTWRLEVATDGVDLRDHDFTRTTLRELMHVSRRAGGAATSLPEYRFPGRFVLTGYLRPPIELPAFLVTSPLHSAPRWTGQTSRARAQTVAERHRADSERLRGTSNVIDLGAGTVFRLGAHARASLEQEYLVTGVRHVIRAREASLQSDGDRELEPRYENTFECIPRNVPFRPPEDTPRPRILGTQTATVVGGALEEIHTDWYGRVKVQFHWDRQSRAHRNLEMPLEALLPGGDPSRLAWVRCAQAWAGAGWGAMFIPRVGMEVVVSFLDGDPDRPLVIGCVYNDANPPPHALLSRQDDSGFRTRSTPMLAKRNLRVGYNELRFRDTANQEQVYLHAERDLDIHVRNNHTRRVLGWQETAVHQNETHVVHGAQRTRVVRNHSLDVGGAQSETVDGSQTVRVGEDRVVEVRGGAQHLVEGFDAHSSRGLYVHHVSSADGAHQADEELERAMVEIERLRRRVHAIGQRTRRVAPPTGHDVVLPRDEHGPPGGISGVVGAAAAGVAAMIGNAEQITAGPGAAAGAGTIGVVMGAAQVVSAAAAAVASTRAAEALASSAPEAPSRDGAAGVPAGADAEPAADTQESVIPPYLETWVVDGNRYKHVRGHEAVRVQSRISQAVEHDITEAGTDWEVTAGRSMAMRVTGAEDLDHAQRLVLSSDPPRLDLRMGANGVKLTPERARLKHDAATVCLDAEGALLASSEGRVAAQLTSDDERWGFEVCDEGSKVEITTKDGTITLTDALTVRVQGAIKIVNGSAAIVLGSGGDVTIKGSTITLDGNVVVK